jgi:mono/diheme cytochrome c family protein
MMPSLEYWHMSDRDLGHIIAYVKSLPPVTRELPSQEPRLLGKVLHVFEVFPAYSAELIDHDAPRPAEPAVGPTREYGAYLAVGTCVGCHGEGMSGGPIPGAPPDMGTPANLTLHATGLAGWSRDDFVRAMREGKRPDGRELSTEQMPWQNFRHFTDVELDALWAHLSELPPRPHGDR